MKLNYSYEDLITLARTLWGECRGETKEGQIAVAWVVRNRAENPGWWSREHDSIPDDTIEAVCRDRHQFSCWWDKQANKVKTRTPEQLGILYDIARAVLDGEIPDPTNGATHYHTIARPEGVRKWPPVWADNHRGRTVGHHIFYKI